MILTALVALAAAVAFGWSTAAMHSDASRAPAEISNPFRLVRHLASQPRWLSGMAASLLGLGLHSLALRIGSLALVQPLVVTGLVFTFLFRALLDRRLPSRRVAGWAGLTAVGLAVFLVAARSTTGSARPQGLAPLFVLGAGGVLAAGCWRWSYRAHAARAGLLLGLAAGVVFGLIAGTLKATTASPSLGDLVTGWPLYVLLALGACGFLLNQTAYRRAPLTSSVPVLNVANPLVALVYGVAAFSERPAAGVAAVGAEAASLAAVLVGVFFLARETEESATAPLHHVDQPQWPDERSTAR